MSTVMREMTLPDVLNTTKIRKQMPKYSMVFKWRKCLQCCLEPMPISDEFEVIHSHSWSLRETQGVKWHNE